MLLTPEREREQREAEILAVLKADAARIASEMARLVAGAQARAARAERDPEEGLRSAVSREQRHMERAARDFAALSMEDISQCIDPHGFYVCCLWGDERYRPLYVGRIENLARLGYYMADPGKGHTVRRITLTRCKNRDHMCRTEEMLIEGFQPRLNVQGVRSGGAARPAQACADVPSRILAQPPRALTNCQIA